MSSLELRRDLASFIPIDRLHALVQKENLPDRTAGTVLFADLAGFTPLTEALEKNLGSKRGAEAVSILLTNTFTSLIKNIHNFHGSVVGFSGDAITCWFDKDDGRYAGAAALAMQEAMTHLPKPSFQEDNLPTLKLKIALAQGSVRRFLAGSSKMQLVDVLAGQILDRVTDAADLTKAGDTSIITTQTQHSFESLFHLENWTNEALTNLRIASLKELKVDVVPNPWPPNACQSLSFDELSAWVLPSVAAALQHGGDTFLAEFRPAVSMFVAFEGIDFDAKDAEGKLDRFIQHLENVLERFDGSLIQITIGDKGSNVFTSFGATLAQEDSATRAVGAALELHETVKELGFLTGLKIGIAFGQMFAGPCGSVHRRSFSAMGRKTNLAARLMSKATLDETYCDSETFQQAREYFAFQDLGKYPFKGFDEPLPIYQLTQPLIIPQESSSKQRFVGRADILALIQNELALLQKGQGQVLLLKGDAGLGKTRLVEEVIRLAGEAKLEVFRGAASSLERETPYRAWRSVFEAYFDFAAYPSQSRKTRVQAEMEKATPKLLNQLPLLADFLQLEPLDSSHLKGSDAQTRQEGLIEVLITLLRKSAVTDPKLLVIEDVHWLDSSSLDLLERVAQSVCRQTACLLLVSSRLLEPNQSHYSVWERLSTLSHSQTLTLEPLSEQGIKDLIANHLEVSSELLPYQLSTSILEQSGGNPFVADELMRNFIEEGWVKVEQEGSVKRVQLMLPTEGTELLSSNLQSLILARFDKLTAEQRMFLKVASVIGRSFGVQLLKDMLLKEQGIEDFQETVLSPLIQRGFIEIDPQSSYTAYLFKHVITHDVIYETLLFRQRRQFHKAVTEWFEDQFEQPSSVINLLAHHAYHAALDSTNTHDLTKALKYLSHAAQDSANIAAYLEASTLNKRILALAADEATDKAWSSTRLIALINLGEAERKLGSYTQAKDVLEQGLELAKQQNNPKEFIRASSHMGFVHFFQGHYEDAWKLGQEAYKKAQQLDDEVGQATLHTLLGLTAIYLDKAELSQKHLEAGIDLYAKLGDESGQAECLNNLAIRLSMQGDQEDALAKLNEAMTLAQNMGNSSLLAKYLCNKGVIYEKLGALDEASQNYREGRNLAREVSAQHLVVLTSLGLGQVSLAKGLNEEAKQAYLETILEARVVGALALIIAGVLGVALVQARQGHLHYAAELLGFIKAQTAFNLEHEKHSQPLVEQLQDSLKEAELSHYLNLGAERKLESILADLLNKA